MDLFTEDFDEILSSIQLCIEHGLIIPAAMLIYACIDIFSWLNCSVDTIKTTRNDFYAWVDTYLMPHSKLHQKCTSKDLYAARCALLHTNTPFSELYLKGEAKIIHYASYRDMKISNSNEPEENIIIIHIEDLYEALLIAMKAFKIKLMISACNDKNQTKIREWSVRRQFFFKNASKLNPPTPPPSLS